MLSPATLTLFDGIHMNNTKTILALTMGAISGSAWAADTAKKAEDTIVVQATTQNDFKPGGDTPLPAFLDGQVANGGRLGMLGQQSAMDVPFNVISYTSKLVEDQQAKTIADVVANDAGVQYVQGYGNSAESFRIRGLKFDGDDMTFGGLSGVLPRQVVDAQMVDRIEIFKGANALMNGAASSAVGGMINLEPKHAGDIPQAKVGVDYTSDSQIGTTLDAGRRFGDNDQFGARVNLVHREGETRIQDDRRRTTLLSTGLDYRGDNFRTSLDVGYQKKPSTAAQPASTFLWSISFPRRQKMTVTSRRNGRIAILKTSSACGVANTTSLTTGLPTQHLALSTRTRKASTAHRNCWIRAGRPPPVVLIPTVSATRSAAWREFAAISLRALSRTR